LRTPARRDLVEMFVLALLLTAAGLSVWLNVTTVGQMITIALAEATQRIFAVLLRPSGPDEYNVNFASGPTLDRVRPLRTAQGPAETSSCPPVGIVRSLVIRGRPVSAKRFRWNLEGHHRTHRR